MEPQGENHNFFKIYSFVNLGVVVFSCFQVVVTIRRSRYERELEKRLITQNWNGHILMRALDLLRG